MSVMEATKIGQTMLPVDDPFTTETAVTRALDWMIDRVKTGYWLRDVALEYPAAACTRGLVNQAVTILE